MKRRLILICIAFLLLAGVRPIAGVFADADHPITMFIQIENDPELESGGTVPDMLFTIRNSGTEDYTLEHAVLSGGYENRTLTLDDKIVVPAGGTKEFRLTDVSVRDDQLDKDITYQLSWKEIIYSEDAESGAVLSFIYERETSAQIRIDRFILPELTVSAMASETRVRSGENFIVTYTIVNDTKYDMSGLRLYDPEQSMQSIGLTSTDLFAGDSMRVEVTYPMGNKDMSFAPVIEYTVRQREQMTKTETVLTVESVVVNLIIETEQYPSTSDGSTFAVTIRNVGNRTVTDIQLYDEINTEIESPFDLAPDQSKVLLYTVPSAVSSGVIRKIQFHVTAIDCLESAFTVTDPNSYEAVPFVDSESVNIALYVVLQRAFYDENGKLCASIQCEIRNFSKVTLRTARLIEQKLFGQLSSYPELYNGETYFVTSLQLDGISELSFILEATDPAGKVYKTEPVKLDLSKLRELADQTDDPVYVTTNNPFLKNLAKKYGRILRIIGFSMLLVAGVSAIICIVLYAVERKLKAKLPPEFEDNMDNAMQKTKRRMDPQIFHDAATEQFGYAVPIKLRNYGELTEQEAEARRHAYQDKLKENLREYSASPVAISKQRITDDTSQNDNAFSGTRIIPITRPKTDTLARDDLQIIPINPIKQEPFEPTAETIRMPVRSKLHAEKPRNKNRLSDEQTQKQRKSKAKSENPVSEKSNQKETSVLSTVKPTEKTIESDMKDSESKVSEEKKQIERIVTQTTEERNPRPIEQTEPQAPRIRKAIEQPVKRSIQPLIVKHMNG